MGIFVGIALVIFVPVCILLTVVILLQDSKGGGLSSSAFGASEMQSILGGRGSATFLTKFTTWLAIGFIVISLFLMRFYGDVKDGTLEYKPGTTQSDTSATGEAADTAADAADQETAEGEAAESTDTTTDTTEPESAGK
jgi:preprotein translocase subunit SecG